MSDVGRFMVAVGAIILNTDTNKVLLIKRSDYSGIADGIWEFPTGRIDQFETFDAAVRREVLEESGISQLEIVGPSTVYEFMRGDHDSSNEVRAVNFACTTAQQEIVLSDEHTEYRWLPIDEAIALVTHPNIKLNLEKFIKDMKL
jgi:8-oxo-dGTP pyrophosphatase MutT (NUDIX family)